jgi:hypothetical protein
MNAGNKQQKEGQRGLETVTPEDPALNTKSERLIVALG